MISLLSLTKDSSIAKVLVPIGSLASITSRIISTFSVTVMKSTINESCFDLLTTGAISGCGAVVVVVRDGVKLF